MTLLNSDEKYKEWINKNYPTPKHAYMKCEDATFQMRLEFPKLNRIKGYAYVNLHRRPHWWLEDENGNIVDPTSHQWNVEIAFYEPIDENSEEPCGKCIECGDLCYRSLGGDSYHCHECQSV